MTAHGLLPALLLRFGQLSFPRHLFDMSLDDQIERLRRCETIKESEVKLLCQKAMEILMEESNVQRVEAPVTVRQSTHPPLIDLPAAASFACCPSLTCTCSLFARRLS